MVGPWQFAAMLFSLILAFGLPVAAVTALARKGRLIRMQVVLGFAAYLLFPLMIGFFFNYYFLFANAFTAKVLSGAAAYTVFLSVTAALIEETGRYAAFRMAFALSEDRPPVRDAGLSFGVGYAGTGSILLIGLTMINYLVNALMLNAGALRGVGSAQKAVDVLTKTSAYLFAMPGLETACDFVFQLALSLLVLTAVCRRRPLFYLAAVLFHAVVKAPVCLGLKDVLPAWAEALLLLALASAAGIWLFRKKRPGGTAAGREELRAPR